jgi:hypothetical protein
MRTNDAPGAGQRRPATFASYYFGTLIRPRRTFDALMADGRRMRFGLAALGIDALLYTLVYVFLAAGGGAPSAFKPWLAIPADVYYYYNRFLLLPSLLLCWILAAGMIQLLGHLFGGKGSFEDTLSALGFAISISSLASLLHDLPDSFLGAIGVLDLREYEVALNSPTIWRTILWILYGLYFLLFLVLFPKAVGASQRIGRGPAIVIGVFSFVVYQVVYLVFNR